MRLGGGVLVANLTPFRADLSVDWDDMARRARALASVDGVRGFVVNAFAAEAPALTPDERQRAVAVHREAAGGDQVVVASIFGGSAPEAIERGKGARQAGAEAVMVCPPYLSAYSAKDSPRYAVQYHRDIGKALDMPMILFQLAAGDQLAYSHEALVEMAREIDQVVAVKMAQAGDCVRYDRDYYALKSLDKPVLCLPAVGSAFFHNLATGADGILTGLASFAPFECVEMLRLIASGDLRGARELHSRLAPLNHAIYGYPFADLHTRYKEVAYMAGAIASPHVRSPQLRMPDDELDRLWAAACHADLRAIPGADASGRRPEPTRNKRRRA